MQFHNPTADRQEARMEVIARAMTTRRMLRDLDVELRELITANRAANAADNRTAA